MCEVSEGAEYVNDDPSSCAAAFFVCDAGTKPFFNDCGCGCEPDDACDVAPGAEYVSTDPDQCAVAFFVCDAGQEPFFNDCGCGCAPE